MHREIGMTWPRWSRDGSYLFFESPENEAVYRVRLLRDPLDDSEVGPAFSEPEEMFSHPRMGAWDVGPENDTILASWSRTYAKAGSKWKVVLNWASTLD